MTSEHLNQIHKFIRDSGIRYYDLEMEVADHISEWIVRDMELHKCSFDASFNRLPEYFSGVELKLIQKSRKKYLSDKYYTFFVNEWLKFFTWPKLILQILFITLSILFFSLIQENNWIVSYLSHLFQVQLLILFGAGFFYRFREMYKLVHETDNILKLLPSEAIGRVGLILRLPMYTFYFLGYLTHIFIGELPLIFYQVMVYSFAIQITYLWALQKTEADARLKLLKEYPDAFEQA